MADTQYTKVANKNDFKDGNLLKVEPEGKPIVLAMVQDKVFAIDAVCSHEGGPLEDGTLEGYELKCPWHYAVFDVRNAKVSDQTVWATDLQSYPVKIDEATGDILVSLQNKPSQQEPTVQQDRRQDEKTADESEKKFYQEEERKAGSTASLELLGKEPLEGTDIMTFMLARGDMEFKPGQFAYFKLQDVSAEDSKGPVRHFSIASSPTEKDYLLISTRIRDSPYKQKLAALQQGAKITVWGPQGEFVFHDDPSKPAVFLSGGIGVTPFRSMVKYATDLKLQHKILMFDSNKNAQSILYKDQFDGWSSQNANMQIIYTLTDEEAANWSGERGRIDKPMLERHLDEDAIGKSIFYICGPPGMLKAMKELLREGLQVPPARIKAEAFTGY